MTLEEAAEVLLENRPFLPCTCGRVVADINGDPCMRFGEDEAGNICTLCDGDGEMWDPRYLQAYNLLHPRKEPSP